MLSPASTNESVMETRKSFSLFYVSIENCESLMLCRKNTVDRLESTKIMRPHNSSPEN